MCVCVCVCVYTCTGLLGISSHYLPGSDGGPHMWWAEFLTLGRCPELIGFKSPPFPKGSGALRVGSIVAGRIEPGSWAHRGSPVTPPTAWRTVTRCCWELLCLRPQDSEAFLTPITINITTTHAQRVWVAASVVICKGLALCTQGQNPPPLHILGWPKSSTVFL